MATNVVLEPAVQACQHPLMPPQSDGNIANGETRLTSEDRVVSSRETSYMET